jgi:hypothetical protein
MGRLLRDVAMFLLDVWSRWLASKFQLPGLSVEFIPDRAKTLKDPEARPAPTDTSPPGSSLRQGVNVWDKWMAWLTSKGAR